MKLHTIIIRYKEREQVTIIIWRSKYYK